MGVVVRLGRSRRRRAARAAAPPARSPRPGRPPPGPQAVDACHRLVERERGELRVVARQVHDALAPSSSPSPASCSACLGRRGDRPALSGRRRRGRARRRRSPAPRSPRAEPVRTGCAELGARAGLIWATLAALRAARARVRGAPCPGTVMAWVSAYGAREGPGGLLPRHREPRGAVHGGWTAGCATGQRDGRGAVFGGATGTWRRWSTTAGPARPTPRVDVSTSARPTGGPDGFSVR